MDWGEIAISFHRDDGRIMPNVGRRRSRICIFGFLRLVISGGGNIEYRDWVPESCAIVGSPRYRTSSYTEEIQAIFYDFDTSPFLKSLISGILPPNEFVDTPT